MDAFLVIACPSCAAGQGRGASDSPLVVGALLLLPLLTAVIAGLVIARLARRASG